MALAISIVLVAGVLLAVGLFAAGRIDGMSPSAPDVPPGLPDGSVTPEALRSVRLPVVLRGYRMADVDELIERAAAELDAARAHQPATDPNHGYEPALPTSAPSRLRPSPYSTRPDVLENDPADG